LSWALHELYLVDVWSLVHLLFFLTLALVRPRSTVILAALLTVCWELFESYSGFLQGDFGGEPWQNRWISDPIFNLFGFCLGTLARKGLGKST
jgi:hypothetical protein